MSPASRVCTFLDLLGFPFLFPSGWSRLASGSSKQVLNKKRKPVDVLQLLTLDMDRSKFLSAVQPEIENIFRTNARGRA